MLIIVLIVVIVAISVALMVVAIIVVALIIIIARHGGEDQLLLHGRITAIDQTIDLVSCVFPRQSNCTPFHGEGTRPHHQESAVVELTLESAH